MKRTNLPYRKAPLILLIFFCYAIYAQEVFTKEIEKSFKMTNTGELHLENKYGNITINGWEENTIAITMNIRVTDVKKEKAKYLFDRISVNIKASGNYLSVISEISDKDIGFFAKYFNKVNPFDFDKSNVAINYTIYLPLKAEIDIKNAFGDVVLDNWKGRLKVDLQHGDLWINHDLTNANINMKFGKLSAKSITYGTIDLKNGGADFEDSKDMLLKISGSNIEARSISNLYIESSKDVISIDHVDVFSGDLKFSNVEVKSIEKEINLHLKVTKLRVFKINNPDSYITINQESSDISININQLNFKFAATLEEGLLRLPKTFSEVKSQVIDEGNKIRMVNAIYGKPNSGVLNFTGKKGNIILTE